MAAINTRATLPDLLFPGIMKVFGYEYESYDKIWEKIFYKKQGTYATERATEVVSFGLPQQKPETSPIKYDLESEGYTQFITPVVWALGAAVSREAQEDGQYREVGESKARNLARSMNIGIETVHAGILTNGFTTVSAGDTVPLFSNAHPTKGGLGSNIGTASAAISEAAIEDLCKLTMQTTDARGLLIHLKPKMLVCQTQDYFNVERILNSTLQSGTSLNNTNALKSTAYVQDGALANPYFGTQATDEWFLTTDLPEDSGLVSVWRRDVKIERDNEFDTENMKMKVTARFQPAPINWRSVFANQGV